MKNKNLEKLAENLNALFISSLAVGLIALFFIQIIFMLSIPLYLYFVWVLVCAVIYAIANNQKTKNTTEFDFYQVSEPLGRQERRKKQNIEERVAIYIDEDGLDPMVIFDETKSGVVCILKITGIASDHKLADYLSELDVTSEQEGHPIAGQTLMEMKFQEESGYYRLSGEGDAELIDFAFPEHGEHLYGKIYDAIQRLLTDFPEASVTKIDVTNYQAMVKFYQYVERLSAPENRCVEYLSYSQGTLKVCNSSYVELYDCTLQSTLTSWISQDGLIRTDNVDVELEGDGLLQLMDIELPYTESRLIDIEIVKMDETQEGVKLYLTFAELLDGTLSGIVCGLSLLMKDNSIGIKRDEESKDELISVASYFEQKSYPSF